MYLKILNLYSTARIKPEISGNFSKKLLIKPEIFLKLNMY